MHPFQTTKYINQRIKKSYFEFTQKYYSDILDNPNKYISLVESAVSDYLGGGYAVFVNSGTTALQFGLLAAGVKSGDEVILPANTYAATAIAITNIGATPVFCDIGLDNFTLSIASLKNCITPKTKVILPVHLYGYACHMDSILSIAEQHGIKVVEDASHAFGGEYHGSKLGTLGDIGAFSCHSSKNFGTFGNGGLFFTKNKSYVDLIQTYMYPDIQDPGVRNSLRTPARGDVMNALVLLFKLSHIDRVIDSNLDLYQSYLAKYRSSDIVFPDLDLQNNRLHIRNCSVLAENRDMLIEQGLGKQFYDIDLSKSPVFSDHGSQVSLPNTQLFFEKNFSFSFYFGIK